MRRFVILCAAALLLPVVPASAQYKYFGTFSWQTQPFCNVITVNVSLAGTEYVLEGHDDLCGADRRAPVIGTATINPNGTVGLGLVVVDAPGGEPTHMDVVLSLPSLSGTWSDSGGITGAFVLNGAAAGDLRPAGRTRLTSISSFSGSTVIGRRANGTPAAPTAVQSGNTLLFLGGTGHNGSEFSGPARVYINMQASETWAPMAHGTRIDFATAANGEPVANTRMRVDHNGRVGIGTEDPVALLHVNGAAQIGNCGYAIDGTVSCASDARFKKGVAPLPATLDRLASLEPVRFSWRTDEYPQRAFGSQQSYGLIAQQVEEVLPELVTTDDDGYKAVSYSRLPLLAIQAIKELKSENDALKERLAKIEAHLKLP